MTRILNVLCVAVIILGSLFTRTFVAGEAAKTDTTKAKRYHIGYRILKVPRAEGTPLIVALWYPSDVGPGQMTYQIVGAPMSSDATPDAPPAKGPFPLLIYSHGGGGCAIMGVTHAEALAENGFVVAGPDYNDDFVVTRSDNSIPVTPQRIMEWFSWAHGMSAGIQTGKPGAGFAHRPKEFRAALDYLLKVNGDPQSFLYKRIDGQKIGALGVSFGAWTTQAVAGFYGRVFQDERIKAVAPIAGPVRQRQLGSFANIHIPVMIIYGEQETIILGEANSGSKTEGMLASYESANPPKYLIEIKGARHLDFGGAGVSRREQGSARTTFSTVEVRNHDRVISTVNHYLIAFFRRYLLGDNTQEGILTTPTNNVGLFKHE